MKEWGVWAPTAQEYDTLGSENAIGETETFDPRIRYKEHQAQYLSYKCKWIALEKAYREALIIRQRHPEAQAKANTKNILPISKNGMKFRVLTPESMSSVKTLKQPLRFSKSEKASKHPRLQAPKASDTLPSSPFSFNTLALSHALDLGPSSACTCCQNGHKKCKSLAHQSGDQDQLADILFQAACSSNEAIAHQVAQIQHCKSLVFALSRIIASEISNMEVLVSNLMSSLLSIRRDAPEKEAVPILKKMRLMEADLLRLDDPNLSPAYNEPLENAASKDTSTNHDPEFLQGSSEDRASD
ncbi:hypothetical protein F5146DRAFT_1004018 [Armillaria mellea]|nr:hypothetical protein F5146DRAFT_1004018 [Armillaria mellea]